jgi:hypothetical protein
MQPFLRWLVVAAVVALLELANGAAAQEPVKQIKLTASAPSLTFGTWQ